MRLSSIVIGSDVSTSAMAWIVQTRSAVDLVSVDNALARLCWVRRQVADVNPVHRRCPSGATVYNRVVGRSTRVTASSSNVGRSSNVDASRPGVSVVSDPVVRNLVAVANAVCAHLVVETVVHLHRTIRRTVDGVPEHAAVVPPNE